MHLDGLAARSVVMLALVALAGCDSKSQPGGTTSPSSVGSGGDTGSVGGVGGAGGSGAGSGGSASTVGGGSGGSGGGGAPAADCYARLSHVSGPLEDPKDGYQFSAFELTDDGAVGVLPGGDGDGYRVTELDTKGDPRSEIQHLWQEYRAGGELRIAVSGDVLAVVDLAQEGDAQRGVCRMALAELGGIQSRVAPTRVSDEPSDDTVLNEAIWCDVTQAGDGFLVVWQQFVSDTSGEFSLFAQRFDAEGGLMGNRLTLASGDKSVGQVTLASDGATALVVQLAAEAIQITFVDREDSRAVVVNEPALQSPPRVVVVDEGLLLQGDERLVLVDREGQRLAGPIDNTARLVAPLDDGYVLVESEEFLVARTLDGKLERRSEASGLSTNRRAHASELLFTPDGNRVALVYSEDDHQRLATLECGSEPVPLGPQPCAETDTVEPLDIGCEDAICHVLVRLDAATLGMRGYAVVGGEESPVASSEALAAAEEVFAAEGDGLVDNAEISGPEVGMFTAFAEPGDFGGFALVSADSGLVVAAGGIIWGGTGHYWTPELWHPANDLACGPNRVEPDDGYIEEGSCGLGSPDAALDVVLRSNLAAHLAQRGPFTAYGYLYTPTVGACDSGVAEYLVVLTQHTD